ncbi:hypothetical protein QYM36_018826 [Artemia franciscana]|uniref:Uncharacterized protein n=1 Tax=Artemia franciscana TaxID=6661 RepID=A0AA88H637_ARTSF|nr:hypothetical protein QYM36_018826 [Artemia franciscana]
MLDFNIGRRRSYFNIGEGGQMNKNSVNDKEIRGRGGPGLRRRSDCKNSRKGIYLNRGKVEQMNEGKLRDKQTRGRGGSGFSMGSKRLDFNSDRKRQYFSCGKGEWMNRSSVNDTDTRVRGGFRFSRGSKKPCFNNGRERPDLNRGKGERMNGGRVSDKETRGRDSSVFTRGIDMLDLNICGARPYFNSRNVSYKGTRGRGRSGFSRGRTRIDFKNGQGVHYSKRGEEEPINRDIVHNQEIASNSTVIKEALSAIIKLLQKRLEITLKERDHCRDEIKKLVYDGCIYETLHNLCHECIKYMMHTENSLNNSESFGFKNYSLIPLFEKILQISCSDNIQRRSSISEAISNFYFPKDTEFNIRDNFPPAARNKKTRGPGISVFQRGSGRPDINNAKSRPYLNTESRQRINRGKISGEIIRGRESLGFSRGTDIPDFKIGRSNIGEGERMNRKSGFRRIPDCKNSTERPYLIRGKADNTRVDLKNGRGSQYSNRGKKEPMNRCSANDQETIEAALMTIEPLIAEIKHLQKRVAITLKERNHCREEIQKIIYLGDVYELLDLPCHECIKYMMHTENSLKDSEYLSNIFLHIKDMKEISLIPTFKKILQGYTFH